MGIFDMFKKKKKVEDLELPPLPDEGSKHSVAVKDELGLGEEGGPGLPPPPGLEPPSGREEELLGAGTQTIKEFKAPEASQTQVIATRVEAIQAKLEMIDHKLDRIIQQLKNVY